MINKRNIAIVAGLFAIILAAVLVGGCGDDGKTSTSAAVVPQCEPDQKSMIPAPGDKPQHVYFYRDT